MSWAYIEINGTKVLRKTFTDHATEQEFLARFPRKMEPGFMLVHKWGGPITRKNRSDEGCMSTLDFFVAPVVDGKPDTELGAEPQVGEPVAKSESLEVPDEVKALTDLELQSYAPQVGARVNQRMPRPQLIAAFCLAIKKNPRNWESVKHTLAQNKLRRDAMKTATVTA